MQCARIVRSAVDRLIAAARFSGKTDQPIKVAMMTSIAAGLGTLVTYNPTVVNLDSPLLDIQQLMDENLIHHLPVVDAERRLVGIVSDLDVARAALASRDSTNQSTVESIMQHKLVTADIDDLPHHVLSLMLAHAIHSVPVLERGRLMGIVTSTDLLREFSYGEMQAYRDSVSQHMTPCRVRLEATATLDEALQTIESINSEYLPVTKGNCPIGVVSLRGLRRSAEGVAAPRAAGNTPIAKLLTGSLVMLRGSDKLGHAASQMLDGKVRVLPVTDRRNELLGLVSQDNVLKAMADEMELTV
jgi:acetoin utilization protein AcuB